MPQSQEGRRCGGGAHSVTGHPGRASHEGQPPPTLSTRPPVSPGPGVRDRGAGRVDRTVRPLCSPSRPNLVSLDLSFNDLIDLQGMVASLSTLQRLRLLVLQGNPLALVPYYRGFTIDSLARLCVLDDVTVSPTEKYQFRGLRNRGGEAADMPTATFPGWAIPTVPW